MNIREYYIQNEKILFQGTKGYLGRKVIVSKNTLERQESQVTLSSLLTLGTKLIK